MIIIDRLDKAVASIVDRMGGPAGRHMAQDFPEEYQGILSAIDIIDACSNYLDTWVLSSTTSDKQVASASPSEFSLFWKFVHNALIHPLLSLPWEPKWAQRAHDWTAKRCYGAG